MKEKTNKIIYDKKEQFCSYWHQIDEIIKCAPQNFLEIGVGNKFLYEYLLKAKVKAVSLDINKDLLPDVVGNVLKIPFKNNTFDIIGCFEVLEHLPFKNFLNALLELYRVAKNKVIISLPDVSKYFLLNLSLPFYGVVKRIFTPHIYLKKSNKVCKEHYWEIGLKNYNLYKIISKIKQANFVIEKNYRVYENPYHRFFILKKMP